ncbi:MAG: hypothetical protein ACRYGP_13680 [Janthinobacterium lividum]
MPTISSSPRVPDASGLGRELYLSNMARALEKVLQLTDPNQRRVELRRARIFDTTPQDEQLAVQRVLAKRRALAASEGSMAA